MFVMFIVVVVLLLCDAIMLMMERCCERLNKTEVHELPNVQRLRLVGWLVGWFPYPPTNEQSRQQSALLLPHSKKLSKGMREAMLYVLFFLTSDPTKA